MVQVPGRLLQAFGQDRGQLESEWGGAAEECPNLAGTDDDELRLLGGPDCAGPGLAQESGHLPQVAPRLGNDGNPFFVDQDFRLPVQETSRAILSDKERKNPSKVRLSPQGDATES